VNNEARNRLAELHLAGRCAVVGVTLIVALVIALPIAYALTGVSGIWSAVAAAGTILVSSIASLLMSEMFRRPDEAMWALMLSMAVRMSLPMAVCLLVLMQGGPLGSGGFVFFVLAFYLVALPIETLLAVSKVRHNRSPN